MTNRSRSKTHPGVSIKDLGTGKHKIRWRERKADGTWAPKSPTIKGTPADAEVYAIGVYEALQTTGTYVVPSRVRTPSQPI